MPGTPAYMAPEVWSGARADERSDIYALGATLFFLLTGTTPFEGKELTDYRRSHMTEEPPCASLRRGERLPAGLDEVVQRCMSKLPEDRVQSAAELRRLLTEMPDSRGWTLADAREFWRGASALRMESDEAEG